MRLRLGTRKSRLALAQSRWVKREIETRFSDIFIELVGIETLADESRGGDYATTPLAQLDGKNFFVKELDDALLEGRTDFSVHSYKDLSLERPEELILAAIPQREVPHDVLLLAPGVDFALPGQAKRRAGDSRDDNKEVPDKAFGLSGKCRIGTSAPRRQENLPVFFTAHYPHITPEMTPIRGNITTRISRLKEPKHSERHLDGVVIALAGVKRLFEDPQAQHDMRGLMQGITSVLLPLKLCPTAPGQGALAIECRKADEEIVHILSHINDPETQAHVQRERALLKQYGGGCHQAFGATSVTVPQGEGYSLYLRGRSENGELLDEVRGEPHKEPLPAYFPNIHTLLKEFAWQKP